jgi:leucyl-tRNA synthetase
MYEMFLGPIEQSKPWDTKGIEGVFRFVRKLWRLFLDAQGNLQVTDEMPDATELKILHKTIKKVEDDIERFSLNTCISSFMICVNELGDLKCNKRAVLEPLLITICPFAPHIAEELWSKLGYTESISRSVFPKWDDKYLVEDTVKYPASFNGKMRFILELPADTAKEEIEKLALTAPESQKWLEGKTPKKIIVVPGKIINIVM